MAETAKKRHPLVIVGPSGAGKSTLIKKLMGEYPGAFGFSVSHTTRKPREGEVNGEHYHFSDREAMQKEIDAGKFIESAAVHGNLYGTSVAAVESVLSTGKTCILDIDVQGAQNVKKQESLGALFLFVRPPSVEALRERLTSRGEKPDSIATRVGNAATELEFQESNVGFFDKVIVNDDLEVAYGAFKAALKDLEIL